MRDWLDCYRISIEWQTICHLKDAMLLKQASLVAQGGESTRQCRQIKGKFDN